jgi:CRP/FNR family transcriptional regulator
MYVVQEGQVEIFDSVGNHEVRLAVRRAGDFIGEMAVLEREVRSASVRAFGDARLLTVDKRNLLGRIHEDPSFAYRLIQSLCSRVRELSSEVAQLKQDSRPD